jgi:hypothetical protein
VFSCSKDAPLSNNTPNKRLRLLGIDTKTDHCAHGFRTTFSAQSHHEGIQRRLGMGWRCRRAAACASRPDQATRQS